MKKIVRLTESDLAQIIRRVIKGEKLKEFKTKFGYLVHQDDDLEQRDINDPLLTQEDSNQSLKSLKALALFNFRAFLNLGMLLAESDAFLPPKKIKISEYFEPTPLLINCCNGVTLTGLPASKT